MLVSVAGKEFAVHDSPRYTRFWEQVRAGSWEPDTFRVFCRYVTPDATVLDIGAWIGATTLYAAQLAKHVYAFEPDPVAHEQLRLNLEANAGLTNVTLCNCGVSDSNEPMPFGTASSFGDSQSSVLFGGSDVSCVEAVHLGSFLKSHDVPDPLFIKIDIEGYEYRVLPSILESLSHRDFVLYLSTHPQIPARLQVPGRGFLAKVRRRLCMTAANISLARSLSRVALVLDAHGRRLRPRLRAPLTLVGNSFTPEWSLVAVSRPGDAMGGPGTRPPASK